MKGGNNMGRRKIEIDKTEFEELCKMMCTREEICNFFKIAPSTLIGWCKRNYQNSDFQTVYKKLSEYGKRSLRRNQFNLSRTNASMAIWLGKQYLRQKDFDKERQLEDDGQLKEFTEVVRNLNK